MKDNTKGNLWKNIFPLLSIILWLATFIIQFVASNTVYSNGYMATVGMIKTISWRSACCIGAIISTAASYVIKELVNHIENKQ